MSFEKLPLLLLILFFVLVGCDHAAADSNSESPDTGVEQGPVEFVIQNNSDGPRFISVDDYVNTPEKRLIRMVLEHLVDGEWEQVGTDFNNGCSAIAEGASCNMTPEVWYIAQPIEPGETYIRSMSELRC